MAKEIRYRITLLRFLISTFFTLVLAACERGYEIKENNPAGSTTGGGAGGGGPARAWKRIFVTSATYNGNLGGPSGADAKCMADSDRPSSGTYKAMIVTDDGSRSASPTTTDWVLAASTEYRRLDDTTIIGTTTASRVFSPPLSAGFDSPELIYSWSGLNPNWTTGFQSCNNWTDDSVSYYGRTGYTTDNTSYSSYNWNYGSSPCSVSSLHLICVEQ